MPQASKRLAQDLNFPPYPPKVVSYFRDLSRVGAEGGTPESGDPHVGGWWGFGSVLRANESYAQKGTRPRWAGGLRKRGLV